MTLSPSEPVDLTNCDREPIHIPGLIQPFGALIAVNSDWLVAHRSTNAGKFLGLARLPDPGEQLANHFTPAALGSLREALRALPDDKTIQRLFGVDLSGNGQLFDIAIHLSDRLVIIEAERHDAQVHNFSLNVLRPMMGRLERIGDVAALCQEGAVSLASLLGLSRVMVYKFHPDNSGEVIAETIQSGQESFLGLRYPASDIPAQARVLYLRNLLRIIGDVNSENVAIEPAISIGGAPVDLSLSTLRAVSPIHVEYLRNMGVHASLSISIVVRGKLWGLFACHHDQPVILPFSLRTSAELFTQLFSLLLDQRIGDASRNLAERGKQLHNRVMAQLADRGDLTENLGMIADAIAPLVRHDGASAFIAGRYTARGFAPNEEEFRSLVPALNAAAASSVIADDELPARIPAAQAFANRAVGALVIPVSRSPRDYVVLWRRALVQQVKWAGNPEKPVEYGPNGARLTPRKSFAAWQQTFADKSEPWSEDEKHLADTLRITLLEVLLRLADEANLARESARQKQELLIAELNHRVRNILTLIRSLIGQSRHEATNIEQFAEIIGGRVRALGMAHDAITRENWNPASLTALIEVEGEAYLSDRATRLNVVGPDVHVAPEAYTVLALVIHELMTNSAKYGSLCDRSGRVKITLAVKEFGSLDMEWREIGGPAVKPPSRRGFGSTIIERSIPHELKGEAQVDYQLSGLVARFSIPARYVIAPADARGDPVHKAEKALPVPPSAPAKTDTGDAIANVLLVEDNLIISMDTEECLLALAVESVATTGSLSEARKLVGERQFDLAILDFNLGDETSLPLAQELAQKQIPVVFATGYGDAISRLAEVPHAAVLKKPYSRDELAAMLNSLIQQGSQGRDV